MRAALKKLLRNVPGARAVDRYLRYRYTGGYRSEPYPRGHYYSPLPDIEEVQSRAASLFNKDVDLGPSIDLNPRAQRQLLDELAKYYCDFRWPEEPSEEYRFHLGQSYFRYGDAVILHAMLRHLKPKRVIEAGSGFTSALMLDTSDRFFAGEIDFTFIEPFPERLYSLLRNADGDRCRVMIDRLQNVPPERFRVLEADDVLFVDSSHVAKIGSDVNYLLFEILPKLKAGVVVHFHDILWPFEYLLRWIREGKAWNEAYLLRAFLQYNTSFEFLLMNSYAGHAFQQLLAEKMPLFLKDTGGSLWIRKLS